MGNTFQVMWRALRSRTLAIALISSLAFLCVVGTVVPQEGEASYDEWQRASPHLAAVVDYLGINEVFTSLPFVVLVAAVGVATTVCAVSRLGGLRGARPEVGFPRLLLSRHRLLGSTIFHLGILLTLAGAAVSSLTRFEGALVVAEGQTLVLERNLDQL